MLRLGIAIEAGVGLAQIGVEVGGGARLPVGGEVVLPAQPVIADPGRMRGPGVDARIFPGRMSATPRPVCHPGPPPQPPPTGSYLVLAHPASDVQPAAMAEMTRRVNERMRGARATLRDHAEVISFFDGLDVLDPGVVQPQHWRPDPTTETPAEVTAWCGVARKS
jgi:S-adenosyl methyltransferase